MVESKNAFYTIKKQPSPSDIAPDLKTLQGLLFSTLGFTILGVTFLQILFFSENHLHNLVFHTLKLSAGLFFLLLAFTSLLSTTTWADKSRTEAENNIALDLAKYCHTHLKINRYEVLNVTPPTQADLMLLAHNDTYRVSLDCGPHFSHWYANKSPLVKWLLTRYVFQSFRVTLRPLSAHQKTALFSQTP